MRGEEVELLDLVRAIDEPAVLVTRFWYNRMLEPRTILATGLTRDGTFRRYLARQDEVRAFVGQKQAQRGLDTLVGTDARAIHGHAGARVGRNMRDRD